MLLKQKKYIVNRKTKIIATVGPSVLTKEKIEGLLKSGVNVLRLNFSHGTHDEHANVIKWARDSDYNCAILQDIQGPKIRTCIAEEGIILKKDSKIDIYFKDGVCSEDSLYIDNKKLLGDIKSGERILIDDGSIVVRVKEPSKNKLRGIVEVGGELRSNQGIALPDTVTSLPPLTKKDIEDIKFGNEQDIDILAVSFVRNSKDIEEVRKITNKTTKVIAKIEVKRAVENLDSILEVSDGAMVARGDLGVQFPLEKLPLIQKQILTKTNAKGKISITATEMLQSMKTSHRPTRAEVTDVTNAIMEGSDAVMLSAETSIGDHPTLVVEYMAKICEEADKVNKWTPTIETGNLIDMVPLSVAKSAVQVANDLDINYILAFTESGRTGQFLSKFKPKGRIIVFSTIQKTLRQMNIFANVTPVKIERSNTTDEMFRIADEWLIESNKVKAGDRVVIVAGTPPNKEASTNLIRVHTVGVI